MNALRDGYEKYKHYCPFLSSQRERAECWNLNRMLSRDGKKKESTSSGLVVVDANPIFKKSCCCMQSSSLWGSLRNLRFFRTFLERVNRGDNMYVRVDLARRENRGRKGRMAPNPSD